MHTATAAERARPLWRRLLPLMGAHFANDFYANLLPALLPLLKAKFGLSLALVGLASTAFTAMASLTQVLFGALGDRVRTFNFAVWGPALTGLFLSLAGLAPSYGVLLGAVVLAGLGTAMFHPQATALAGSLAERRRGLAISLFIAGGTAGFSLSPVLAALLFTALGLGWGSGVLLLAALLAFALLRHTVPAPPAVEPIRLRWWDAFRPLAVMWLIVVLRHAVYLSFLTYLIILLEARGLSYQMGSAGLFLFLLGSAASSLLGGPLSDRFGRRRVVFLSFLLAYPLLFAFLHGAGWTMLVWLTLAGMALALNNPVIVAHAQELFPRHAGTASAITMGFGWGVGSLLVSPVGAAADRWGMVPALDGISLAALLAALLALRIPPAADGST